MHLADSSSQVVRHSGDCLSFPDKQFRLRILRVKEVRVEFEVDSPPDHTVILIDSNGTPEDTSTTK